MSTPSEPRNPLYFLLLLAGLVLAVTGCAVAIIPVMEQKAAEAGNPPPPSAFRDALRADGWKWLLVEVAVLLVLAVASIAWDKLRGLQKAPPGTTIPPEKPPDT